MAYQKPTEPYDAATKDYVDYISKTHIITTTASYHGDLIKGDYQFTFGESSKQPINDYFSYDNRIYNGFLMPQSGYIKRFVVDELGLKFIREEITANTTIPLFTLVSN